MTVFPAKTGIQGVGDSAKVSWVSAFVGKTKALRAPPVYGSAMSYS